MGRRAWKMPGFLLNWCVLIVFLAFYGQNSHCRTGSGVHLDLYAEPEDESEGVVMRKAHETLILHCDVLDKNTPFGHPVMYEIEWGFPTSLTNRHYVHETTFTSQLIVPKLQVEDTGHYRCGLRSNSYRDGLAVSRYVVVRPDIVRPPNCGPKMFVCGANNASLTPICIPTPYICDGRVDCPESGDDESLETCGTRDACFGKLPCSDGRCIPNSWCCDPKSSSGNCRTLVRPRCCNEHTNEDFPDPRFRDVSEEKHQLKEKVGFLQTTVYTITVCALVFLVAVVLLGAAIARMHQKSAARRASPDGGDGGAYPPLRPEHAAAPAERPGRSEAGAAGRPVRLSRPLLFRGGHEDCLFGELLAAHDGSGRPAAERTDYFADDLARQRALRRVNALERILDRLGINGGEEPPPRPRGPSPYPSVHRDPSGENPVLRIGSLRVALPAGLARARSPPPVRSRDTYTLNGRTILLGADCSPFAGRPSSPPSYVEAVGAAPPGEFAPPPPYSAALQASASRPEDARSPPRYEAVPEDKTETIEAPLAPPTESPTKEADPILT